MKPKMHESARATWINFGSFRIKKNSVAHLQVKRHDINRSYPVDVRARSTHFRNQDDPAGMARLGPAEATSLGCGFRCVIDKSDQDHYIIILWASEINFDAFPAPSTLHSPRSSVSITNYRVRARTRSKPRRHFPESVNTRTFSNRKGKSQKLLLHIWPFGPDNANNSSLLLYCSDVSTFARATL